MTKRERKTTSDRQKEHRCYKCIWSRWGDAEQVFCMFNRCFKEVDRLRYIHKG